MYALDALIGMAMLAGPWVVGGLLDGLGDTWLKAISVVAFGFVLRQPAWRPSS